MRGGSQNQQDRFLERIHNELNLYLRGLRDPRLQFASITKVELNQDNSVATIFWDTFDSGKRGDIKKTILSMSGEIRTHLSKVMKIRQIPELRFEYDGQYEAEQNITKILDDEKDKGRF